MVVCGLTHLMEVWNLWHANYWLAGVVKAITAATSVPTAILLMNLAPLELPSAKFFSFLAGVSSLLFRAAISASNIASLFLI